MFGFRRRNRTAGWVARPDAVLTLDLDAFTLCGAAVGDHVDTLSLLGPGEPGMTSKEYLFPDQGVTLDLDGDTLAAFHAHFPGFRGVVRHRGQPVRVNSLDGVAACVTRFGEPDFGNDDVLTYMPGGREWELILEDGRVTTISVY